MAQKFQLKLMSNGDVNHVENYDTQTSDYPLSEFLTNMKLEVEYLISGEEGFDEIRIKRVA